MHLLLNLEGKRTLHLVGHHEEWGACLLVGWRALLLRLVVLLFATLVVREAHLKVCCVLLAGFL